MRNFITFGIGLALCYYPMQGLIECGNTSTIIKGGISLLALLCIYLAWINKIKHEAGKV